MSKAETKRPGYAYYNVNAHKKKLSDKMPLSRQDVLQLAAYTLLDRSQLIMCLHKISRVQYMQYRKRILSVLDNMVVDGQLHFFITSDDHIETLALPSKVIERELAITQIIRVISNKRRLKHLLEKFGRNSLKTVANNLFGAIETLDNEYSNDSQVIFDNKETLQKQLIKALST